MPQYRVLEKSYLDVEANGSSRICEEGEIVTYVGFPGRNLEPLDDEGRAKAEEHRLNEVKRKAAMLGAPDPSMLAWSPEMVAQMAAMIGAHGNQPTAVPGDVAGAPAATKASK